MDPNKNGDNDNRGASAARKDQQPQQGQQPAGQGQRLSVDSCTAKELAIYLLKHRFSNNSKETIEFLQSTLQTVTDPNAVSSSASDASGKGNNNKNINVDDDGKDDDVDDWGVPLLQQPLETSLLNPRAGKFQIQFYTKKGFVAKHLKNPTTQQLIIPPGHVSNMILFAKPEDCKNIISLERKLSVNKKKKQRRIQRRGEDGNDNDADDDDDNVDEAQIKKLNSKIGAHLVLLQLKSPVSFSNTPNKLIDQVCFALSWSKGIGPTGPVLSSPSGGNTNDDQAAVGAATNKNDDTISIDAEMAATEVAAASTTAATGDDTWSQVTHAWRQVLVHCLRHKDGNGTTMTTAKMIVAQVHPQKVHPFRSFDNPGQSTTTGGMPFVKCYHGVQDGILYPMEEGLLFYKPPKYLPRSQLRSIACGREGGGGKSASRYVDMVLQVVDNDAPVENNSEDVDENLNTIEFTNIQREEVAVLNNYIHQILIPAMSRDVDGEGGDDDKDKDNNEAKKKTKKQKKTSDADTESAASLSSSEETKSHASIFDGVVAVVNDDDDDGDDGDVRHVSLDDEISDEDDENYEIGDDDDDDDEEDDDDDDVDVDEVDHVDEVDEDDNDVEVVDGVVEVVTPQEEMKKKRKKTTRTTTTTPASFTTASGAAVTLVKNSVKRKNGHHYPGFDDDDDEAYTFRNNTNNTNDDGETSTECEVVEAAADHNDDDDSDSFGVVMVGGEEATISAATTTNRRTIPSKRQKR